MKTRTNPGPLPKRAAWQTVRLSLLVWFGFLMAGGSVQVRADVTYPVTVHNASATWPITGTVYYEDYNFPPLYGSPISSYYDLAPGATYQTSLSYPCTNLWFDTEAYTNGAIIGTRFYSSIVASYCGQPVHLYLYVADGKRPNDTNDGPECLTTCSPCGGMPVWSVSEPYLSLWLRDEPLGYQPTLGPRISFELAFKQRESSAGLDTNIFSVGKKWNCSWFSYVTRDGNGSNVVHLASGKEMTFSGTNEYLTNTRLTGDPTNGFTLAYPDGSQDIYGFIVTNNSGAFLKAFVTERRNPQSQKTRLNYASYNATNPVIRLQSVVDGDGRTNTLSYATNNSYSTNLISQVVDAFGRTTSLGYDTNGHLTSISDVAGLSSSMTYDTNAWVTSLSTPYGTTSFSFIDGSPNYRSVLVTGPDGGRHFFHYNDGVPGLTSAYATNQVPVTSPFGNTFDNTELNRRNSFYWGPRQYENLSTTNFFAFSTNDFLKARMRHWLKPGNNWVGETLSLEREPSPDSGGTIEGQKTWYDYAGKTNNAYEGTQVRPLFAARVLPDGTTWYARTGRNELGAVTNHVSTYTKADGTVGQRTNTFTYAPNKIDELTQISADGTQVSSNQFNASHQVLTNFNALNEMTVHTYDSSNRVTSIKTPAGLTTTNFYNSDGRLTKTIDLEINRTNSFTYTNGLVYSQTDERGLTITNTWNNLQRLIKVTYPDGTFITNTYNNLDVVRVVDRMGFTHSMGYDALRRKIAETNALGRYELASYCTCGSRESVRDAAGNFTFFHYDNVGRELATVYPDGYAVTNRYNLLGQVTSVIDSAAASVTNWFNNQGLQFAVSNAFGRLVSIVYDVLNRPTNVVDANGVSVNATFDNLNRPLTQSYPDGGVEKWGYTMNVAEATSYTNQLNQVTRFGFDAANRLIAETNANNEVTLATYNGAGDRLTLTDGKNQTTRWGFDIFGRPTSQTNAVGTEIERFQFDPNNRATNRWTAAKGNTVYKYDLLANQTNVDYAVSPDITLQYDALNQLTNMVDAVGTTKRSYTAVGQLLSEDGPWANDTVTHSYTHRLRASLSLQQPTGSWTQTYVYDVMKRLTNLTSSAGSSGYQYPGVRPSTLVSRLSLPNGAYITNNYDSMARLTSTRLLNSQQSTLNSHSYGYNLASQRTVLTNKAGDYRNYTYDNAGQLKTTAGYESDGSPRLNEKLGYAYDPAGNLNYRTNNALVQVFNVNTLNELSTVTRSGMLTVAGNTTTAATNVTVNSLTALRYADKTFAKDGFTVTNGVNTFTAIAQNSFGLAATNQITVNLPATNNFVYDLNGNLLSDGFHGLDYDDENQLIRVTVTNVFKKEFVYDGANRLRIRREYAWSGAWTQTNETRFICDGVLPIQHRDSNNVPTLTLTRGLDLSGSFQGAGGIGGLLAMTENSGAHSYYHADGNGNVTCLLNTNQLVVAKYLYDPFGYPLSYTGPKAPVNQYWFSSELYDTDTGFVHYLLRVYIPSLQRFANRDPIGEAGGNNLFQFVKNDPGNEIDPLGLSNRDVFRITKIGRDAIDDMTKKAQRINDGFLRGNLNNFTAWWCGKVCRVPAEQNLKGCGEQADTVLGELLKHDYDDTWIMTQVFVLTPPFALPHQYLILHSKHPKDPIIIIDPQKNKIDIENFPKMKLQIDLSADVYTKPAGNNGTTFKTVKPPR